MKLGKKLAIAVMVGILSIAGAVTSMASSRLDTVQDPYWDEDTITIARWEEVEDAYQYEIYLYRDDSKVASAKTKKEYINLKSYMKVEGDYTFKVRALAKGSSSSKYGYWSEESDACYISETYVEYLENGGKIDTTYSGPGALETEAAEETTAAETEADTGATEETAAVETTEETTAADAASMAGWQLDETGYWYRNEDGSYPANGWWQDTANASWYYFNEQGYMMTGWIDEGDVRYYCDPTTGAMVTGSCTVDGVTYMFDPSGALQEAMTVETAAAEETTAETEEETTAAAETEAIVDAYIGYESSDDEDD